MKKLVLIFTFIVCYGSLPAQDSINTTVKEQFLDNDPGRYKIVPDKLIEFGVPVLLLFLLLNTVVTVLKNRSEQQLKLKMIDKGVSEETLLKIFSEANAIARLQPLKWLLFTSATGIALVIIHFLSNYLLNQSGFFAIGIVLILNSIAFALYYALLTRKK